MGRWESAIQTLVRGVTLAKLNHEGVNMTYTSKVSI